MQFQFPQKTLKCLSCALEEVKHTEVTQELRLTDGMPDIGRVLAVWGQVMLRSKQWMDDEISLSGGVKMWVLYAPEDNTQPRVTEGWIPFQIKWDVRHGGREGTVRMMPLLRYADGRSVSARKMMLRAGIGVLAQGMCPMETEVYVPEELPEQVQVLKKTYPVWLPVEAGEKTFQLDEDLEDHGIGKLISYRVCPEITEKRVLADKIAFKGCTNLHLVFLNGDGRITSKDYELPFSQLIDLDGSYGSDARGDIRIAVTDMEADLLEEGNLRVKCAMVAQYLVDDRQILELAEDAYCPGRALTFDTALLELPAVLEENWQTRNPAQTLIGHDGTVADACYLPDHPRIRQSTDYVDVELPGIFQILYYRDDGTLQWITNRCEETMQLQADENCHMTVLVRNSGQIRISAASEDAMISAPLQIQIRTGSGKGLTMLTSLELGQSEEPDPGRPSVILRRAGDDTIWDIAKECSSTVEAIQNANEGTDCLTADRMLLIPVI